VPRREVLVFGEGVLYLRWAQEVQRIAGRVRRRHRLERFDREREPRDGVLRGRIAPEEEQRLVGEDE